jgi:hypothetical protein
MYDSGFGEANQRTFFFFAGPITGTGDERDSEHIYFNPTAFWRKAPGLFLRERKWDRREDAEEGARAIVSCIIWTNFIQIVDEFRPLRGRISATSWTNFNHLRPPKFLTCPDFASKNTSVSFT